MISFVITFRETLEAALIVGIICAYLTKTKNQHYKKHVNIGIISGIFLSIIGAIIFNAIAGGFEGKAEEIFEGITMIIGALLIATVISWMSTKKNITQEITNKVDHALKTGTALGILFLVTISILREGIETVIFLNAAMTNLDFNQIIFALLGIIIGAFTGFVVYKGLYKVNLKTLFNISSVLLILFSAGLFAHGIHELQEAGVIPVIIEHVWDINPADKTHPFHENGLIGSFLKTLFGYNGNPSLLEVLSYIFMLLSTIFIWKRKNLRS
ncbi:high-affinity iron transporter [Deferribacter autotrophicus]|uniref:High-affinity iron transporter n=1 Tax=Deferribacter autotrophicus TaxID=500465 RepID=A0A5A8F0P4_9BACT|nr:FTR1 family protein [Deferribacter autotrophicus]KAA0256887.1 high-affinity iron transporter [Deferribacter autotrophicus]